MKKAFNILPVLFVLSTSSAFAQNLDCKEAYTTVLRLAAENTLFSKGEVANRANIAIAYGNANRGPGPAKMAKQVFLQRLDMQSQVDFAALLKDQASLKDVMKNSADCFASVSAQDKAQITEMLDK